MRLAVKDSQLGLRNSTTRLPFRYGVASLTRCPQAVVRVTIECDGRVRDGYSGDCLPPSWFDKSPEKGFEQQITDMLRVIGLAQGVYAAAFASSVPFLPAWLACHDEMQAECSALDLPPLLASFGSSLLERAVIDAVCRRHDVSFARAIRGNLLGIDAGLVHAGLRGLSPAAWVPAHPSTSVFVRQTVGMADALEVADIAPGDAVGDGRPQAVEEYVTRQGVRYCKVKVANDLERDLDRLTRIAGILEAHRGDDYRLTLDGNEQYKQAGAFERLIDGIRSAPRLTRLWNNVVAIEQPFDRAIALTPSCVAAVRGVSHTKPVIIDESDDTLDAYPRALEAGYRGVSSKACKGAIKSLLNAGLTWLANDSGRRHDVLMTGEDLCSVGIVPVQSDLCLAATLGLDHVERNGHHYHPGLSYLPEAVRDAALAAHPDFYAREHGMVVPRIRDGRFDIRSLQCVGFGFAVEPDLAAMQTAEEWTFASLWDG